MSDQYNLGGIEDILRTIGRGMNQLWYSCPSTSVTNEHLYKSPSPKPAGGSPPQTGCECDICKGRGKSFNQLRSRMSPEAQKEAKLKTDGMLNQISSNPKDQMGSKKAPMSLTTYDCVKGISEAMYYGAFLAKRKDGKQGYGPFNWRSTPVRLSIYLDATLRHTFALANGEDVDPDSGLPHEYHIGANMNIIIDAKKHGTLIDDRLDKRTI